MLTRLTSSGGYRVRTRGDASGQRKLYNVGVGRSMDASKVEAIRKAWAEAAEQGR